MGKAVWPIVPMRAGFGNFRPIAFSLAISIDGIF